MADTKLSALTAATPASADLVYLVQNGNSRRATAQGIANLAPGTNLLYVAATRLLSSSTGDDVTLPLFTSSLAGLVKASGGGDVNFLRADGEWVAPPSSATDLSYNASTRVLASSTGADVTLPLATDALAGLTSATDKARIDQLGVDDSPTFAGLTITGTAAVEIPHIHGDLAGKVYAHVRNATGVSIAALVPYHVTGAHGDTDVVTIEPAQASNPATMPAAGVTYEAIASNASGHGVVAGVMTGVNTSGLTAGDALYVASGGGLTATRPTSGLVQVVAIVGRVHATTGTIVVALGSVLPSPADATPAALGTAAIGSSIDYAREDHVHAMPTAADVGALPLVFAAGTISYAATVDLDMAALAGGYQTISLTGNLTFTTSNQASGRTVTLRLICDATQRTLTFPAGWVFVGTKPSNIAASKTAVLSLSFFGTADTNCVAAYGVQS